VTNSEQRQLRTVATPWLRVVFIGGLATLCVAILTFGILVKVSVYVLWSIITYASLSIVIVSGLLLLRTRLMASRGLAAPGDARRARLRLGMVGCLLAAFVAALMPTRLIPTALLRVVNSWSSLVLLLMFVGAALWLAWQLLRSAPPIDLRRAQRAYGEGRLAEALELCESAQREQPDHWAVLQTQAMIHREMGHHAEALEIGRGLVARWPDLYHGHVEVGMAHLAIGDPVSACVPLGRAVEIAPLVAIAHYNLGMAYADAKHYPEAIDSLATALRLDLRDRITALLARHQLMVALDAVGETAQAEIERARLRRQSRVLKRYHRDMELEPAATRQQSAAIVADIEKVIQRTGDSRGR